MKIKNAIEKLWASPLIYSLHFLSVDGPKIRASEQIGRDYRAKKVLELGCGTGNKAAIFIGSDYTGLNINPTYIAAVLRAFPLCVSWTPPPRARRGECVVRLNPAQFLSASSSR